LTAAHARRFDPAHARGAGAQPVLVRVSRDPYPTYRRLRDEAPLYRNDALGFWALSRYRDVLSASLEWETYSSAEGTTLERMDPAYFEARPMIIFLDPPRHDRCAGS
jgi:cytochrome P450